MTPSSDVSLSADRGERPAPQDSLVDSLEAVVLPMLREQASELGARWEAMARSLLLLNRADGQGTGESVDAEALVAALLARPAGREPDRQSEDMVEHGLKLGASAFVRGASLHQVLKSLDLLASTVIDAMESTVERLETPATGAAAGVRLCGRLHRQVALLSFAATRGYMQAYAETLREGFRHLRHDLRNPLGTIKSVLALMEDESVPLEARVNPNFRAMATRNARVLEELIADRLGDAAALLPVVTEQDVPARAITYSVRQEPQGEVAPGGATVVVEHGGMQDRSAPRSAPPGV